MQYPVFSPFSFPPDQFSSLHPFPFSQPPFFIFFLRAPSSFPPFVNPAPASYFFPLSSSCCLHWQSGRRRHSAGGAELAALAACIIHVPCSLCVGLGILLASHRDARPSRLCVRDAEAPTEGTAHTGGDYFLISARGGPSLLRRPAGSGVRNETVSLVQVQECLLSVSANSAGRPFTIKSFPQVCCSAG